MFWCYLFSFSFYVSGWFVAFRLSISNLFRYLGTYRSWLFCLTTSEHVPCIFVTIIVFHATHMQFVIHMSFQADAAQQQAMIVHEEY